MTIPQFRKTVWTHYKKHGRHALPWRALVRGRHDPYRVLVSEIMLQQTQVDRVVPYFSAWMKRYPNIRSLAEAPLSDVLQSWQGLGYNRRAKMLHDAAKAVVERYDGKMPSAVEELEALPGVGPYTARAVAAFAYNQDVVFVETNLRTAVIHHFYADCTDVTDTEIREVLAKALPTGNAREWYAALMDYGTHLKRSGVRVNAKSKGYAKQPAFKGSGREVRGAILRALAESPRPKKHLIGLMGPDRTGQSEGQLSALLSEGLVQKAGRSYRLPA